MARSAPAFSSFTAGEISPRLEGRTDLEKYRQGLSDLTNMVVMPHGGVQRRPGTQFISSVKDSAVKTRLLPFQFKAGDTYILEFGDQNMRVIRNDEQVLDATDKTITGVTQANPGVITSASHGFSNGDEIYIDAIAGMTELNGRNYLVANVTTNTFTVQDLFGNNIDTTAFTAYTSGGTATEIYNIATPYAAADLFDIRFVQSADTMYLVHPSYDIRTLTRTDHNAWSFATMSITGTPSPALSGADDRPSVVAFFEQRLVFANTNNNPQTLWFSKNGDYTNFTVGTADDDALIYTIASNQSNAIRFLSSTAVLTVGTSGGEYVLTSTSDGPITPTTTLIRKYSNYGSAKITPVQVADVTLFVQRGNRKMREFKFVGNVNVGGYSAPDMTILAEHITNGGIVDMAYQQEPDSIVWVVRSDGVLCGMTYQRSEQVVAWHRHILGGVFGSSDAVVESVAAIPNSTAASQGEDTLYMIVKRTVNGATRRYVEFLKPFDYSSVIEDAWFLDSALQYSGSAVTSVSGLDHLEGQTVSILANGATHANKTVSDGSITLDRSATKITVGLPYTSSLQTMRIESGSADGSAQGKTKRIQELTIRLFETVGAEVGSQADNTDIIPFRDSSMAMDQAVSLFSGDKQIEFNSDYETDGFVFVKQTQPLPLTVTALYPQLNTYDG